MKYRYYIASVFDGCVRGTNDERVARAVADEPETFVVDAVHGSEFDSSSTARPVEEFDEKVVGSFLD